LNKQITEVPVYIFTGFLESGKTKFAQETLEDKRFCTGEKTLILVCEEGEEEYAPDQFADKNVSFKIVESQDELTVENLDRWVRETKSDRVMVEYNGMWLLDALYGAMPEGWQVYQEIMFADANTFIAYNANMRNLVYDKLKSCELVVFNRFKPEMDKMAFHKIVRAISRRTEIAYESMNGKVEYDEIEDPLPFDVNAPVIKIEDTDYALWYRDMSENPKNYEDKTVIFKGRTLLRKKLPDRTFVVGRHVMTCCVEDIQFAGVVCQCDDISAITDDAWVMLTAKINFKFSRAYGKKGPVLTFISAEKCDAPDPDVATFY